MTGGNYVCGTDFSALEYIRGISWLASGLTDSGARDRNRSGLGQSDKGTWLYAACVSQAVQIRQQVVDLVIREHVAEAFHLIAAQANDFAHPLIIGGHAA